ncbi:MAG TPA: DUF2306 domain-containing protein [Dokdonella sp.]
MNAVAMTGTGWGKNLRADAALTNAARCWFLVAAAGQWIFAFYIAFFYGGAAASGHPEFWNKVLPHGYVPGNTVGNAALGVHLMFAAAITVAGTLQLIPQIRARLPRFHRWNGRLYVIAAFTMGLTGLYLVMSGRKVVGDAPQHIAVGINAILIMLCAAMTWRYALARDFSTHRRWALRLFLVVNGVWFFRVELMFWLFVNQGPVGFDPETFTGPFLTFLSFSQMLLPLAVLELYLRARDGREPIGKFATAAGLVVLTAAMGLGEFAAFMGMWLPRL